MSNKRILVTGGAGFIGNHVQSELIEHGYTPVVFDHYGRGDGELLGGEVVLGDIRDATAVSEAVAHVDGVIHLAAVLGTQETVLNPRPAAETNLLGGLNVFEALAAYQVPGVYICVGNHFMNNPYAITKTTVERFAHMYNKDRGTRINMVRAVNAYGPGQSVAAPFGPSKVRKITPAFICRALSKMPIEIYGDGTQVSDMVYVKDVAKALVLALGQAQLGNVLDKVVEVGPSIHTKVEDVANLVLELAVRAGYPPLPTRHLPMRPGEVAGAEVTANPETLRMIGFDPKDLTPLEDGMDETVRYYVSTKGILWDTPSD